MEMKSRPQGLGANLWPSVQNLFNSRIVAPATDSGLHVSDTGARIVVTHIGDGIFEPCLDLIECFLAHGAKLLLAGRA